MQVGRQSRSLWATIRSSHLPIDSLELRLVKQIGGMSHQSIVLKEYQKPLTLLFAYQRENNSAFGSCGFRTSPTSLVVSMRDIRCRHSGISESLSALGYACICGNLKLAHLLIDLGHPICEASSGWKRSLLVLAILGWNERKSRANRSKTRRVWNMDCESWTCHTSHETQKLMAFFQVLIRSNAKIQPPSRMQDGRGPVSLAGDRSSDPLIIALNEGHTPLTAASLYHNTAVVDELLVLGANILDRCQTNPSALALCISNFWNFRHRRRRLFPYLGFLTMIRTPTSTFASQPF